MSNRGLVGVLIFVTLGVFALLGELRARPVPIGVAPLQAVERPGQGPRQPWLIALHGLGDSPDNFIRSLGRLNDRVHVVSLGAPGVWQGMRSWFPMDSDSVAARGVAQVAARVAAYAAAHTDTSDHCGKPVVTGFSQGGILSFALAAQHANPFAASVPMAGRLYGPLARNMHPGDLRVHALHGADDARISVDAGRRATRQLKRAGAQADFQSFPHMGHELGGAMYRRWLEVLDAELSHSCP